MHFDLPIEQLRSYLPQRCEPPDFDEFWQKTLSETHRHPLNPSFKAVDFGLKLVETYDLTFNGYAGQPIKGWFIIPRNLSHPLPCIVQFIGYGGGRGFPADWLLWPSAGYAVLVMDTRGQGSIWRNGDTPDPDGSSSHVPGFMTNGILSPETYYFRRLFMDAVRAVKTAQTHPYVDPQRVVAAGQSQGGGLALAVSGLTPGLAGVIAREPFLCHIREATSITDTAPYNEITKYCKTHRHQVDQVFNTLSYFDCVNFSSRAVARALFSVSLMDDICPPRTVFAAYNHFKGPKEIRIWEYNQHEGGDNYQDIESLGFASKLLG